MKNINFLVLCIRGHDPKVKGLGKQILKINLFRNYESLGSKNLKVLLIYYFIFTNNKPIFIFDIF